MPENASVFNQWAIFPETSVGVPAAATDIVRDFGVMFTPQVPSSPVQPIGNVFRTGFLYGKEHSEGRIDGSLGYQSFPYLGCSLFHTATPTAPAAGSGGYTLSLGAASAGTFTLTYNGATTAGIVYTAAAATVQTALEGLATVGVGNVVVTGTTLPTGPLTILFAGPLANTPSALTGSGAGLTGGTFTLTPVNAPTLAKRWLWTPGQSSPDTFQTYTVEMGSTITASRVSYAQVSALEVNYTQDAITIGGTMLAQRMTDNFGSLATGLTEVLVKPVSAAEVSVWLGNSYLGMTRMSRPLEARLSITNRVGPVFTLNDLATSYVALVQLPCEVTLSLTVEHDTETHAFLSDMRAGTTKFVMVEAVGPLIEAGYPYRIRFTMPMKLTNPSRTDQQGVHASVYEMGSVYAENVIGTRDFAIEAEMVNSLAAL